jgi:hypothetical protein
MKNSVQTAALALLTAAVAISVAIHSIDGEFSKLILWEHIIFLSNWKLYPPLKAVTPLLSMLIDSHFQILLALIVNTNKILLVLSVMTVAFFK